MKRTIAPLFAAVFLLAGCNTRGSAEPTSPDGADGNAKAETQSVMAEVSGDRSATIKAVADFASIAALPGDSKTLVTITGAREDGEDKGVSVTVVAGMPPLAKLIQGSTTIENGIGSVSFQPASDKSEFSTMFDYLFYATAGHADSGAKVTFTKVTKLSAANHVAHYRFVGTFSFNAASNPEPISQPCVLEATKAVGRIPRYNPTLCGAQRVRVSGQFDSTTDVLEK